MMTAKELKALNDILEYIIEHEEYSYYDFKECAEDASVHIYHKALIVSDYVKGLYSTGSV